MFHQFASVTGDLLALFGKDAFCKENSEFNQKNATSLSTITKLWLITRLLSWRKIRGKEGANSGLENLEKLFLVSCH